MHSCKRTVTACEMLGLQVRRCTAVILIFHSLGSYLVCLFSESDKKEQQRRWLTWQIFVIRIFAFFFFSDHLCSLKKDHIYHSNIQPLNWKRERERVSEREREKESVRERVSRLWLNRVACWSCSDSKVARSWLVKSAVQRASWAPSCAGEPGSTEPLSSEEQGWRSFSKVTACKMQDTTITHSHVTDLSNTGFTDSTGFVFSWKYSLLVFFKATVKVTHCIWSVFITVYLMR